MGLRIISGREKNDYGKYTSYYGIIGNMKLKIPIVEVQPIKHHESVSDAVLSCYPQDTMDGMEWNGMCSRSSDVG